MAWRNREQSGVGPVPRSALGGHLLSNMGRAEEQEESYEEEEEEEEELEQDEEDEYEDEDEGEEVNRRGLPNTQSTTTGAIRGANPNLTAVTVAVEAPSHSLANPASLAKATRRLYRTDAEIIATPDRYPVNEEACSLLPEADQDFVYSTKELFDQIDDALLSSDFVPHEHVIGIIAESNGRISKPAEIEEKLCAYRDLEEEIALDLEDYIHVHQADFNGAVRHFSEMILAVSGSDDEISRLKEELHLSTVALDSHAEQLLVLRQRAAKSFFMAEYLRKISDALQAETQVRRFIEGKNYYSAVELLRAQQEVLYEPSIRQIRTTQRLRDYVDNSLRTLHTQIISDVMACVFREERLIDAQNHSSTIFSQDSYSLLEDDELDEYGAGQDWNWESLLWSPAASAGNVSLRNYTQLISLSVKSLMRLGKLPDCHEAYFSKATQTMEFFVSEFVRLYDHWRRQSLPELLPLPGTTMAGSQDSAAVKAIRSRSFEWQNDMTSSEEAIALVQRRELQSFLLVLLTELTKIIRNAAFLRSVVLIAHFPFLAEYMDPYTGRSRNAKVFSIKATRDLWNINPVPMTDGDQLRRLLQFSVSRVTKKYSSESEIIQHVNKTTSAPGSMAFSSAVQTDKIPYSDAEELSKLLSYLLEFFTVEGIVQSFFPSNAHSTQGAETNTVRKAAEKPPIPQSQKKLPTLRDLLNLLDGVAPQVLEKYPETNTQILHNLVEELSSAMSQSARDIFEDQVRELLGTWDLQPLWVQLQFHIETVCRMLCGLADEDSDSTQAMTATSAASRNKADAGARARRLAVIAKLVEKDKTSEEYNSLEKVLSNVQSSTGMLRMMSDVSLVSFRLSEAVRVLQQRYRRERDHRKEHRSLGSSFNSGDSSSGGSLLLNQADTLRQWFAFTPMNVLACYDVVRLFVDACFQRVPELAGAKREASVLSFFVTLFRTHFIPSLQSFHSQQLQRLLVAMRDASASTQASGPGADDPSDLLSGSSAVTGKENRGGSKDSTQSGGSLFSTYFSWPTVTVSGCSTPLLPSVLYIGQFIRKVQRLKESMPIPLREELAQTVISSLLSDLTAFLQQKLKLLCRGTIHARLLHNSFGETYLANPDSRWSALCNEKTLLQSHQGIDRDLYIYYQHYNSQRTSGHQYNTREGSLPPEALTVLSADDVKMEELALTPPQELSLKDDSVIVSLAVLCASAEWLADTLREATLSVLPGTREESGLTGGLSSIVPGGGRGAIQQLWTATKKSLRGTSKSDDGSGSQRRRLLGHLVRLYAISQASLFYLSIEARWIAFLFIPQLRDESYNVVAASTAADSFVQAYVRRISTFYTLLRQHLPEPKLFYTCLTAAKPASELVLLELAHLRDKAISKAGLLKLHTDLLVIQTAWQLVLPTSLELRESISAAFVRPATFLRYIHNTDVVAELLSTGDNAKFSEKEIEVLIRLVFRQVSGANNDELAVKHIDLYHRKVAGLRSVLESGAKVEDAAAADAAGLLMDWEGSSTTSESQEQEETDEDNESEEEEQIEEEEEEEEYAANEEDVRGVIHMAVPPKEISVPEVVPSWEPSHYVDPAMGLSTTALNALEFSRQRGGELMSSDADEEGEADEEREDEDEYEYEEVEDDDDDDEEQSASPV